MTLATKNCKTCQIYVAHWQLSGNAIMVIVNFFRPIYLLEIIYFEFNLIKMVL